MERPDYIPRNYARIQVVGRLSDLFNAAFDGDTNAFILPRPVPVDFGPLADAYKRYYDFNDQYPIRDPDYLKNLRGFMTEQAQPAFDFLMSDVDCMQRNGYRIRLAILENEQHAAPDIACFHEDAGYAEGRILVCYNGNATQWIRNEDAVLSAGGLYESAPGAEIHALRPGDVVKFATPETYKSASSFIHRAPPPSGTTSFRFLLTASKKNAALRRF